MRSEKGLKENKYSRKTNQKTPNQISEKQQNKTQTTTTKKTPKTKTTKKNPKTKITPKKPPKTQTKQSSAFSCEIFFNA